MKVNRKNLFKLITEAMEDDELTPRSDFEKLMSALTSDLSNARQAWEMYDLGAYELSPEEEAKAREAMVRVIVTDSDNPGKDLKEIDYDFHQVFMDAYGFTPPKSKEFQLWGGKTKDEELSLRTMVAGKEIEFEFYWDEMHLPEGQVLEPWFRFETMHGKDGYVTFEKGVISINEDDYSTRSSKEELPSALRSAMGISWDADVPEWPELPKGQPPVDGPEGTDEPVYEGKRKLNKSYLFETIAEVMSEIGENFGATPGGDLLHEAWDSQWPVHFSELKERIKEYTDKGRVAEDILSKYALEAMSFNHLGFKTIWDAYGRLFKAFIRTYVRDEGDLSKVRKLITNSLSPKFAEDWKQKFSDARRDKGNEGALRVLNKLITSLDKQIRKIWRSMEDKGVDWNNVEEEFDREITQAVQKQQFRESAMITSRILEIIQFVEMDKSDDNAKKLAAFYKKIKQAANSPEIDVSAIADEVNIVQLSLDFVEDQMMNIDMTLCPDSEVGQPCVMHQFDDGFFWYDISADTCELTARKMNSCGDASMSGSELFNLMSHSETGKPRWHVTVEWNEEEKAFIQVLGNANTVPKQEYWPYIKWLYEKYGKPEISNYAWEHVQGDNVKPRVFAFLQYLGLKSREPTSESWVQMKQQISDGFYNVRSWGEGERPVEDDWSKLSWIPHSDRVAMAMRIKRKLLSVGSGLISYEDIRDYKAAARKLENEGVIESLLFQDMIPQEWNEFFDAKEITQRVRFSHAGNMILYFNWTSKKLQDPSDGNYRDDEYMKQLQREMLARFMNETKQNFSAEQMNVVAKLVGRQLEKDADDWAMKRDAYNRGDDLDEESQNILSELLQLNESEEPEFELPEFVKTLLEQEDHLIQAIELLASANGVEILCDREDENAYRKEYYFYVASTAQASLLHHQLAPFFRLKRAEPGLDMWVGVGWPTEWPENWKECEKQLGEEWVQNGAILNISVDKL